MNEDKKEIDCPRCGGYWYNDLDESGVAYTCFHCCNGTVPCYEGEEEHEQPNQTVSNRSWH
jgi:hypothetical protein